MSDQKHIHSLEHKSPVPDHPFVPLSPQNPHSNNANIQEDSLPFSSTSNLPQGVTSSWLDPTVHSRRHGCDWKEEDRDAGVLAGLGAELEGSWAYWVRFDLLPCFILESHRIAATFIFGVPLTLQQEKLKFRMRGQVF